MERIKEKLQYSIDFKYRTMKNGTLLTIMDDEEIKMVEECLDVATKEELMDLLKVYHKEVKRIKLDIKEIIENE